LEGGNKEKHALASQKEQAEFKYKESVIEVDALKREVDDKAGLITQVKKNLE
jgi:hypothetical protein